MINSSNREFSKTFRFDFPRIPIIGTLLAIILFINFPEKQILVLNKDGDLNLSLLSAAILALGISGICSIQLLSLTLFDLIFPAKKFLYDKDINNKRSCYAWFEQIKKDAKEITRSSERDGDHSSSQRYGIKKLTNKQIHATLHSLEMECRQKSPSFGIQIEYYYSLYLFFFSCSLLSSALIIYAIFNFVTSSSYNIPLLFFNIFILIVSSRGVISARQMKEHLRRTLLNHDRKFVLELIGKWFHCHFHENSKDNYRRSSPKNESQSSSRNDISHQRRSKTSN